MRLLSRQNVALLAVLVAAIAASAGAYALASIPASSATTQQIKAHPGPQAFVAAYGLKASEGQPAFTLHNGQTVSVIDNGATRCLLHGVGSRVAGRCFPATAIGGGAGIAVSDECGSTGKNLMEITGLAPDGTVGVRLNISDGSSQETTVAHGAFRFEGTNPAPGSPYPTGVEWLNGTGAASGSAPLPVSGDEFCLPAS